MAEVALWEWEVWPRGWARGNSVMGAPILMYFSDMLQPPTTASASGLKSLSQPGPLSDPSDSWSCLQIKTDRSARVSQTDHFTSNKTFCRERSAERSLPCYYYFFISASCPEHFCLLAKITSNRRLLENAQSWLLLGFIDTSANNSGSVTWALLLTVVWNIILPSNIG